MELIQSNIINQASELPDVALTAILPHEMVDAQNQLISWCAKKIVLCSDECVELAAAHDRAVKMKWKSEPLHRLHLQAKKRVVYYEKVKAALEAGYYIVPNFPIDMFAIRTKKKPTGYSNNYWALHRQDAQELPIGEGEYKNPFPIRSISSYKDSNNDTHHDNYAEGWDDLEFPITMAKPNIMDVSSRAMALKIFDQIGILPSARKKEDPVIIGQVKLKNGSRTKLVSFMIAWHLDTSMI